MTIVAADQGVDHGQEVLMKRMKILTCVQGHHHHSERAALVHAPDHEHLKKMVMMELKTTKFAANRLSCFHIEYNSGEDVTVLHSRFLKVADFFFIEL